MIASRNLLDRCLGAKTVFDIVRVHPPLEKFLSVDVTTGTRQTIIRVSMTDTRRTRWYQQKLTDRSEGNWGGQ